MNMRLMKQSMLCAFALFCSVTVQSMYAQKLEEVLAKHYEARGGLAKLQALKSIRFSGKIEIGGGARTLNIEQTVVIPNKVFIRIEMGPGVAMIQAYNGKDGYVINPMSGSNDPQLADEPTRKSLEDDANILGDLINYKEKNITLEFLGQEDVEGSPTFKIKATNQKKGSITTYFLDKDSYLEVKSVRKTKVQDKEQEMESYPSDYKTIDGYTVPMIMKQSTIGMVVKFNKFEFNPTIADNTFDMPAKK
jgi:hypothetical protein